MQESKLADYIVTNSVVSSFDMKIASQKKLEFNKMLIGQILVYSKIFERIRPNRDQYGLIGYMANCAMCMGFWVGMFLFFINGWTELFTFKYSIGNMFICGWLSSGTSYMLSALIKDEGLRLDKGENK